MCIVGNGPSAEGRGREIDGCDFVVRVNAWWRYAAEDAGSRIDAVAWFGADQDLWSRAPKLACEHWRTWCLEQYESVPGRREYFDKVAAGRKVYPLCDADWKAVHDYLHRHPSTGFIAIAMAINRWPHCELYLYGFDSTTPDRPNYWDARGRPGSSTPHDMVREKRAIAGLIPGRRVKWINRTGQRCNSSSPRWLGQPSTVKLIWSNAPL